MLTVDKTDFRRRRPARTLSDRVARGMVRAMSAVAAGLTGRRDARRTIVMETIAAVPGMVGAMLLHLKCLRRMIDDRGWIRTLMDEAENQRTHLMVFVEIARPSLAERLLVLLAQGVFFNAHFLLYLVSPRTAHRVVGYFAEDAVAGYTQYVEELETGRRPDPPAPPLAIAYWNLEPGVRLSGAIRAMREDEAIHRDVNHAFADALGAGRTLPEPPPPEA